MDNLPRTRKEALESGASHYFTGKACKNGHIAPRKAQGMCTKCEAEWNKKGYQQRKEQHAKAMKAWRERNKDYYKDYRRKNNNGDRMRANGALWRARKYNSVPAWYDDEEHEIYTRLSKECARLKRETGVTHSIDHVVPLVAQNARSNGQHIACGLHYSANWQIIPVSENVSKGAKLPDDL